MAYNVCEFFVGAGGSHLGFIQQGFKTLYVNDIDKDALKTLLHNNKELKDAIIDQTSITEIDPKKLQTQIKQEVDVIFAGIVCKSFSLAGERSPNDKRNYFLPLLFRNNQSPKTKNQHYRKCKRHVKR
nr:DNA cytosine methyltransferase [Helicobacter pylori]